MTKTSNINHKNYQIIIWICIGYILLARGIKLSFVQYQLQKVNFLDQFLLVINKTIVKEYIFFAEIILLPLLFVSLTEEDLIHKKTYIKRSKARSKVNAIFYMAAIPLIFLVIFSLSFYDNANFFYAEATFLLLIYIFYPDFIFSIPIVFPNSESFINRIVLARNVVNNNADYGYDSLSTREKILNANIVGHKNDTIYFKNRLHNGTTVYNGNPRRSNLIVGSAGSGKSDSILNPWIKQTLDMEIPMFLYDFKFPVQTKVALYYYLDHKKRNANYPLQFHMNTFNGDFLHNVWRLSPINKNTIETVFHSDVYINTLFSCMNKRWIKSSDFWAESTIAYGSAVTLAFKKYMGDKFTLPHIIHFLSMDYVKQVQVLINLDDDQINAKIENIRKPVIEEKGGDQLSGIFSTMQNFMSKMHNPNIFFAISKEETSLDLNNSNAPVFLAVGNDNFYRKVFSPLISLYTSIVFSVCNKQNKLPLHFMADEAPTLYLAGVEDFINTGRSNGMITTLGMQSMAQTVFEYGNELARVIEGSLSNVYFGQLNDYHTQQYFCKTMGTYKRKNTSQTYQTESYNISLGENHQVENFLRYEEIGGLDKGYFAGKVSEGNYCKFMGKVDIAAYLPHFKNAESLILPLSPTVAMLEEDGNLSEDDIYRYYKGDNKANQNINNETLKYADKVYKDIMKETKLFMEALI
ncbi:type IV secretory system conjugative DNA transfer family protein [Chondrinema litorale]|uniref:type IV secretory system conjugative DNA transfer family protein n=1 Tax=Chondrinema litorale TaxID=2994555 RepID=UPI0025435A6F|nr:TraM recognition domain-containing protein [Chondrinema litorale]UZR99011.1 TraM recognition domain-containing protein [Chondrinema litorale]